MSKERVTQAALERFPFLARYVRHPSVWSIYLEPIGVDLARKHPEVRGSWRCPCQIRLVLLNVVGDEIGFVGERQRVIPASKFLWWTVSQEEIVVDQFHETVEQALKRFQEKTHWVVLISEQGVAWGYNATMFSPPSGQTVNECLTQKLEEAHLAEEARLKEYDRRSNQQHEEALAAQRKLLDERMKEVEG